MSDGRHRRAAIVFGERVRGRRVALGWSQMRLADEAGLHFTYVSSVERGERNISLQNIVRLAAALGVDPAELTTGLAPDPVSRKEGRR
jgi:transcriptional regulator with XRE-family HTH domain